MGCWTRVVTVRRLGEQICRYPGLHRSLLRHGDVTHAALHALWQQRRTEDPEAMAVLGSALVTPLSMPDAVFRPEIERWSDIWERQVPPDHLLRGQIISDFGSVAALRSATLIAPLAVGRISITGCCPLPRSSLRAMARKPLTTRSFPIPPRPDVLDRRLLTLGSDWEARSVEVTPHMSQRHRGSLLLSQSDHRQLQISGARGPVAVAACVAAQRIARSVLRALLIAPAERKQAQCRE